MYVNASNKTVRWSFTAAAGSDIRIKYRPLLLNVFPDINQEIFSVDEISRRESLGGRTSDGRYERLIVFEDLEFGGSDPIQSLLNYGAAVLKAHSWPLIEGTFETTSDNVTGWKAGQTMQILSDAFDIFDLEQWVKFGRPEGTIRDPVLGDVIIDAKDALTVWIKSVNIKVLSYNLLHYTVTFTTRPRSI